MPFGIRHGGEPILIVGVVRGFDVRFWGAESLLRFQMPRPSPGRVDLRDGRVSGWSGEVSGYWGGVFPIGWAAAAASLTWLLTELLARPEVPLGSRVIDLFLSSPYHILVLGVLVASVVVIVVSVSVATKRYRALNQRDSAQD